jgi:cobalamin biosynthetic protein CobC
MTTFHHAHPSTAGLAFHGGRLDEAARCFPQARLPWIDLSTGISPFAWPVERMAAPDLHALPSADALARLCAAAARHFGAEALPVTALPGSEIGLRLLAQLGLPQPWRVVAPGYRTHGDALPGATPIAADTVVEEAARGGTILLANPGNPDGRLWSSDTLLAIAGALAAQRGVLIVDEAFADAVPGASILPLLGTEDRVLVFRSFGKFFGLAGVRLGFACGDAGLVSAIADRLGSWPVSATAIACGTAAYADTAWIEASRTRLDAASAALDGLLDDHGLEGRGACPLFRLVETERAASLFEHLAREGILTRPFDYAPHWLRLGLPPGDAALARLDVALRRR